MLPANKKLIQFLVLSSAVWLVSMPSLSVAITTDSQKPDEQILWRLFNDNKIAELKMQLNHLQKSFPGWQPPQDLLNLIQRKEKTKQVKQKTASRFIAKKTINRPLDFCEAIGLQWQNAELASKIGDSEKTIAIYQRIIKSCNQQNREKTLEKAYWLLNYNDFMEIAQFSESYIPAEIIQKGIFSSLKKEYFNKETWDKTEFLQFTEQSKKWIDKYNDDKFSAAIAWRYFDFKEYQQAQDWFKKSLAWDKNNSNAQVGFLLSLEKIENYQQLLDEISLISQPSAKIKTIASRVYKFKAWQAYKEENLDDVQKYLNEALKLAGTDSETQEIKALLAHEAGEYEQSAELFEQLYKQSQNKKYAQGYIRALSQIDPDYMSEKAEQAGGVLLDEYKSFYAKELYDRKQFQSAYKLAPAEFPDLVNIDSPYVEMGAGALHRSGEDGTGNLDLLHLPSVTASYTVGGVHNFKVSATRISMYSGTLDKCVTQIGSFPDQRFENICRANTKNLSLAKQELQNAVELEFFYRKDGWFSPFFGLGITPISGGVEPTITFTGGFTQQTKFGYWTLEGYSKPVRQSILSYTGINDPYHGTLNSAFNLGENFEWGRVLRTGLKASLFYRFNDMWSFFGSIDNAWLHGKNVADNATISVSTSLARNFAIPGFDYFSVGPLFSYQHFNKNLNHFTLGQGGYFSPENYYNIGLGVNFLTDEGRDFIIKGRFSAGFQSIDESSSPWFPLHNASLGSYSSARNSGEALDFEVKGVWLAQSNIQIGGGASFNKTNGYQDYVGGVFVRYTWEKRKAVYSTDIPDSIFSAYR